MAFFTPRVAANEVIGKAYNVFQSPYNQVEAEWQRFFAGVSGPSRLRGVSFTDAIRLGQTPNLADRVVMMVDAPQGRFWKAISYDFYTGNGWRTTETDKVDKINPPVLGREKFDATFEIMVPQQNLLFGANEPVKVSVPFQFQTGSDRSYSIAVRAVRSGQASEKYTVTSYVSVADKAALRRAASAYPDYIRQKYLQLPSTLPQRVRDLAHKVAGEQTDPYDKAETIESFLRTTYRYAPTVRAPPAGRDPVDFFLFDLKEDFCEYFASSMVVMLRELGVPARVVEGYTAGTLDPTTGKFQVKELDAHSWVEVYFPQYGWIEFEPTPSQAPIFRIDSSLGAGGGDADTGGNGGAGDPNAADRVNRGESELDQGGDGSGFSGDSVVAVVRAIDPRPIGVLLVFLLVLLALAVARFNWRFRSYGPIESAWAKTRLLASYVGYPPHHSQTTYEFASALGAALPETAEPVHTIAEARVRERYSTAGVDVDIEEAAVTAWHRAASSMLTLLPGRILRFFTRLFR